MLTKSLALLTVLICGAAALADEVVLSSGEVLKVGNVRSHDGRVEMDHPVLGHLDLAADQVTAIRGTDAAPAPAAAPPAPAAPAAAPGPKWKYKAELGLNGQTGNSRTTDLRAAVGALLETPDERWKIDGAYMKSKSDGATTKNNWYAQGLHDWIFNEGPWSVFATGRYDQDRFQAWYRRVSVGVGAGYKLLDEKNLTARLRAGFNEIREYDSDDEGWRPEGLLGAEASYKINANQSLEAAVTYYPDLQTTGEYRLVMTAAWSIKLSTDGLSLKLGLEDEIDSHRVAPAKKQDLKYFAALLYEF